MQKKIFILFLSLFILLFNKALSTEDQKITTVIEGVNFPVDLTKNKSISDQSVFVLEHKTGKIIEIQNFHKNPIINPDPILDIGTLLSEADNWEQGLNGFAFSPNFEKDKYIFVSYNNRNNEIIVSRFIYDDEKKKANLNSEKVLLRVSRLSNEEFHNCGTIVFHPIDGNLYTCIGDTASPESSQNINNLNGKILRIDPFNLSKEEKYYSIVEDNPFHKIDGKAEIIFSGLRNPWKFSFDSENGDIYVPDVGSEYIEELNIVKYKNFNNYLNFGWNCFEGDYRIYDKHYKDVSKGYDACIKNLNDKNINFVKPKLQYFHDSLFDESGLFGNSIIGGVLYKNKKSIWHDHYFFGDIVSSNIWYLDTTKKNNYIGLNFLSGEDLGITSINQIDNKLIATSYMGKIYQINLPMKKDYEKSIYRKPIINNKIYAIELMNKNNEIIFTTGSKMYKLLKSLREYKNRFLDFF